jgi:hypothetical protein
MALYGDNLAAAIRPGTTCQQASDAMTTVQHALQACYASLTLWSNWKQSGTLDTINLAVLSAISPDDAASMKAILDDELAHSYAVDSLVTDQAVSDGWDSPLSTSDGNDLLGAVAGSIGTASSAIALCDRLFHASVASSVADSIVPVTGDLADKVSNLISKVVGNFLAGIWWVLALAGLVLWASRKGWFRP